ncbi:MAG: hypothetical protein DWH70_03710 [Planctomycetota bacterium]|nr:MAG: hypothetical protein DWH70_03710 [Planctomycetota bacterium]
MVENLKPAWFNPPGWFFICLHIIKWRRLVNLYRLWKLGALRREGRIIWIVKSNRSIIFYAISNLGRLLSLVCRCLIIIPDNMDVSGLFFKWFLILKRCIHG